METRVRKMNNITLAAKIHVLVTEHDVILKCTGKKQSKVDNDVY